MVGITLQRLLAIGIVLVKMFLVVEEQVFRCSCFNLPFLFSSKRHGFKAHGCHFDKSDPGQAHLKQQCKKNTQTTFASPSKSDRKEKEIEGKEITKRKANAIKIQLKYYIVILPM